MDSPVFRDSSGGFYRINNLAIKKIQEKMKSGYKLSDALCGLRIPPKAVRKIFKKK